MNNTTLIIANRSIDGYVCCGQLTRYSGGPCRWEFPRAGHVPMGILAKDDRPSRVYVAGFRPDMWCVARAEELTDMGIEVYWIDNHDCDIGIVELMRRACTRVVQHDSPDVPVSAIIGEWLEDADPLVGRMGWITANHEAITN